MPLRAVVEGRAVQVWDLTAEEWAGLAAHGSERHDRPPNMSNFCWLPGTTGGLPVFIYGAFRPDERERVTVALREVPEIEAGALAGMFKIVVVA